MRLLQGDCCKPRVSHQSPPSTRFQPPRVKSDNSSRGGAWSSPLGQGAPPARVPPGPGPSCRPHAWYLDEQEGSSRRKGLWESTETRPQEERGAMGLPIQMGIEGAHIKPLSDFEYPKWVQQHISPETAHCPVGPTSWVSESSLYHSLPWHDIHHASSSVISPLLALPRPLLPHPRTGS